MIPKLFSWWSFIGLKRVTHVFIFAFYILVYFCVPYVFSGKNSTQAYWSYTFVTRSGSQLYQNGVQFRFSGANIPWLGLDNSTGGTYPSQFRIENGIKTAKEMGATVIRSHTMGISVGCRMCIEPTLGQFNEQAFVSIDYALKTARDNGIRVIIPLTDNWKYYHGGKSTFTQWRGLANEDFFYSDPQVIQDFKDYITKILNHVNPYTGKMYKNEPAILAWETGNELENSTNEWDDNWTEIIAKHIKSLDKNHLIIDGHPSNASANRNLTMSQLLLPSVDIYTGHFYPVSNEFMKTDARLAKENNKAYFIGEYDWTNVLSAPAEGTINQDFSQSREGTASAKIATIKSHTVDEYISLIQGNASMSANTTYAVSFSAKSSISQTISVRLKVGKWPWTLLKDYSATLTPQWQDYIFWYTPSSDQPVVLLDFNFAKNIGDVWLDNVKINNNGVNQLINGTFEGSGYNWIAPWTFKVQGQGDSLQSFLSEIENPDNAIAGDTYWQLYGHDDLRGFNSGDQYTLHYPGDTPDMKNRADMLRTHGYVMGENTIPSYLVPTAAQLQKVSFSDNGNSIDWRGTIGADSYNIERTQNGVQWQVIARGLKTNESPWIDKSALAGQQYSYRVIPYNAWGSIGKYSNIEPGVQTFIQNGSFDQTGLYWNTGWNFVAPPGYASFTQDVVNSSYKYYSGLVDITSATPASPWNIQLRQFSQPLIANQMYTITFKAKATDTVQDAKVLLQDGWLPYTIATQQIFDLTTGWIKYGCNFAPSLNYSNAMLVFNLGKYPGKIWFDEVSIKKTNDLQTGKCLQLP